jgi:O-antigen ligase
MTTSIRFPRAAASNVAAVAMLLAAVVPMQIAYSIPPSGTFFNQAAALLLWGVVVALLAWRSAPSMRAALAPAAPLAILGVAAVSAGLVGRLPASMAVAALGVIVASVVMVASGASARGEADGARVLDLFFAAWVVAGVLTALVCIVQVLVPGWADGQFIAIPRYAGRAVGNIRQSNQVSSQLLWSAAAVLPLIDSGRLKRGLGVALFVLMVLGVVLSGSRTGMVGIALLVAWGLVDSRLARSSRALLLSAPLWFGLFWLAALLWASASVHDFGGAARFAAADPSSSRFALWANTLSLIAHDPWAGVGFGGFNFAWVLTPFPTRPIAIFDHTHNLELQLAVELGLPLAALVLGLLGWVLWRAWRNCRREPGDSAVGLRAAFVMLLTMALHSQLEYPLWLAYFLLPTAWVWGYCLGRGPATSPVLADAVMRRAPSLVIAGLVMVGATGLALVDYARVARIYIAQSATPLAERIASGQRSVLFAHHADYAAAVTASGPAEAVPPLRQATHFLLDPQIMVLLVRTLAAQGDFERARHVAQRLREFRHAQAAEFLSACEAGAIQPPTFHCEAPTRALDWHDFR